MSVTFFMDGRKPAVADHLKTDDKKHVRKKAKGKKNGTVCNR